MTRIVDFGFLPPLPYDYLTVQAQVLEAAFYRDRHLDPAEWRELAAQFKQADRPNSAEHTLENLSRLQSIAAQKRNAIAPCAATNDISPQ